MIGDLGYEAPVKTPQQIKRGLEAIISEDVGFDVFVNSMNETPEGIDVTYEDEEGEEFSGLIDYQGKFN